jgi:hypothetical protein
VLTPLTCLHIALTAAHQQVLAIPHVLLRKTDPAQIQAVLDRAGVGEWARAEPGERVRIGQSVYRAPGGWTETVAMAAADTRRAELGRLRSAGMEALTVPPEVIGKPPPTGRRPSGGYQKRGPWAGKGKPAGVGAKEPARV